MHTKPSPLNNSRDVTGHMYQPHNNNDSSVLDIQLYQGNYGKEKFYTKPTPLNPKQCLAIYDIMTNESGFTSMFDSWQGKNENLRFKMNFGIFNNNKLKDKVKKSYWKDITGPFEDHFMRELIENARQWILGYGVVPYTIQDDIYPKVCSFEDGYVLVSRNKKDKVNKYWWVSAYNEYNTAELKKFSLKYNPNVYFCSFKRREPTKDGTLKSKLAGLIWRYTALKRARLRCDHQANKIAYGNPMVITSELPKTKDQLDVVAQMHLIKRAKTTGGGSDNRFYGRDDYDDDDDDEILVDKLFEDLGGSLNDMYIVKNPDILNSTNVEKYNETIFLKPGEKYNEIKIQPLNENIDHLELMFRKELNKAIGLAFDPIDAENIKVFSEKGVEKSRAGYEKGISKTELKTFQALIEDWYYRIYGYQHIDKVLEIQRRNKILRRRQNYQPFSTKIKSKKVDIDDDDGNDDDVLMKEKGKIKNKTSDDIKSKPKMKMRKIIRPRVLTDEEVRVLKNAKVIEVTFNQDPDAEHVDDDEATELYYSGMLDAQGFRDYKEVKTGLKLSIPKDPKQYYQAQLMLRGGNDVFLQRDQFNMQKKEMTFNQDMQKKQFQLQKENGGINQNGNGNNSNNNNNGSKKKEKKLKRKRSTEGREDEKGSSKAGRKVD